MTSYALEHELTEGRAMTATDACAWARDAEEGDHLIDWDEILLSEFGLSDPVLDDVRRVLDERGLSLEATDEGLVVVVWGES